jgi:hypothetical protein
MKTSGRPVSARASPQFAHTWLDDLLIIRDNPAGGNRTTRGRMVTSCLFTDPQVGDPSHGNGRAAPRCGSAGSADGSTSVNDSEIGRIS